MAEDTSEIKLPTNNPIPEKSGRWDFLKKPLTRRNFLKIVLGGGGAVGLAASGAVAAEKSLDKGNINEVFRIGNNNVRLEGQDFIPKEGISDPEEAVLFLVGAPMRANASVTWGQPRELADQFKVKGYTLDARPEGNFDTNSLDLETEAIRQFIKKNGIKKITIFGHSIGAAKAIKLAASLEQNNPDIQINGIVCANAMGFYEQDTGDLMKRYGPEAGGESKLANPRSPHESILKTGIQLAGSVVKDVRQVGLLNYKKWVGEQFDALTKVNPELAKVKAPVVLLVGSKDLLSQAENIFPKEEIAKRLPPTNAQGQLQRNILDSGKKWVELSDDERVEFGTKKIFTDLQRQHIAEVGVARDQYAKETYLPQVENLQTIVGTKHASHIGFTVERTDEAAHVSAKIFNWLRREASNRKKYQENKIIEPFGQKAA